jgi:hypothetical protein
MKPLRLLIIPLLCVTGTVDAQQTDSTQVDLVDLFIKKKSKPAAEKYRSEKKVHFSLFPAATSVPGGGKAVVTAINATFYTGDPALTNLSNIYIIPYTNLSDRYGLYLRPNIWIPKNKINILGDYRIAHFPQYSWGLGGDSPQWDETLIDSDLFRFYQTVLFKIYRLPNWYLGPGYALDHHYNIEELDYIGKGHLERFETDPKTSTTSSGFSANLVYDARINAINPPRGAYLMMTWRWNTTGLGSTYTNHTLFIDGRKYIPWSPTRNHILTLRSYYWTVLKGETPYLDLPATSWAPASGIASRGFETGRYRSNAMLYAEAEQRYQLTSNGLWGMVMFMNVVSASEYDTQHFKHWHAGAGVGVRTKLNKFSNTNLAVDLGFSQDYWSVWLNIGEVF